MRLARWLAGAAILLTIIGIILVQGGPAFFEAGPPFASFVSRGIAILILAAVLCVFRVLRGPTAADRLVAIDILGILIVGVCALACLATRRAWYIDIGIAWALQSFIGALAFSKYLERKAFDE